MFVALGLYMGPRRATFLLVTALAAVSGRPSVAASGSTSGIVIHGPEQTLRDHCSTDAEDRMWLELPGGARYELVTSTADPAIANAGDGSFHPFEEAEVRAALAEVRYPLGLSAVIYLLPFPRRTGLESAAGPGLILLSPGVLPLTREHQHAELVHELGHVVQYALMPDDDAASWNRYRELRGIQDAVLYGPTSAHADRPHEIFAEDFRALFGGATATHTGTIENATLTEPGDVPGLRAFLLDLAGPVTLALAASPNPGRGAVRFSAAGVAATPLDLFDVTGRRVATLPPSAAGGVVEWSWNGSDARGRRIANAVLWARTRDGAARARLVRLP